MKEKYERNGMKYAGKFENKTIMAHKLAAMRLLEPSMTQSQAVEKILLADDKDRREAWLRAAGKWKE